jgi:hypothetical protein
VIRATLAALAVIGCASREPPAPEPTELAAMPLVPASIAAELGPVRMLFVGRVSPELKELVPPFPCRDDVTRDVTLIVVGGEPFRGFVDGMSEQAGKACIEQLASLGHFTVVQQPYGVEIEGRRLVLSWSGNRLRFEEAGAPRGPVSERVRWLATRVPANAFGYIVAAEIPSHEVQNVVVSFAEHGDHVRITGSAERSYAPDEFLERIATRFANAARSDGSVLPANWYSIDAAGNAARFVGNLPLHPERESR